MGATEGKQADYAATCDGCGLTMDGDTYQAAEALSHQCGGDVPGCFRCGGQDWTFTQVED